VANDYHFGSVKNIEFNIVKQNQEVIIAPMPAYIKKGKKMILSARASSGLELSEKSKSTEICNIDKSNIVALRKGSCVIEFNQIGSAVFKSVQKIVVIKIL
jgi:hypothetical protein